jgi:hypothetical protein
LLAIYFFNIDRDIGGYQDSFFYIDKVWHTLGGLSIQLIAHYVFKVATTVSIPVNLLVGLGLEYVQYLNGARSEFWPWAWRDWVCDNIGILIAWALSKMIGRRS